MESLGPELAAGDHQRFVVRRCIGGLLRCHSKVLVLEKVSYLAESAALRFSHLVVDCLEEIRTEPVQRAKAPVAGLVKCSPYRLLIISSPQRSECDLSLRNAEFHVGVDKEAD